MRSSFSVEPRRRPRADRLTTPEPTEPWREWRPATLLTTEGWNRVRYQIEDWLGGEVIDEPSGWDDGVGEPIPGEYLNEPENARQAMSWIGLYAPTVMRGWLNEQEPLEQHGKAGGDTHGWGGPAARAISTLTESDRNMLEQSDVQRADAYTRLILTAPWLGSSFHFTTEDISDLQESRFIRQRFAENSRLALLSGAEFAGFESALDNFLEVLTARSILGSEELISATDWQQFEEALVTRLYEENQRAAEDPVAHIHANLMRAAAHSAIFSLAVQAAIRQATSMTTQCMVILAKVNTGDPWWQGNSEGSYEPQLVVAAMEFLSAQNCSVRSLHATEPWTELEFGQTPVASQLLPARES